MNITNQTISNVTPSTYEAAATVAQENSFIWIYALAALALLIAFIVMRRGKTTNSKKEIALVGQRGAGKTQLLITICGGQPFPTVPSISNNAAELKVGSKPYRVIDFIGDNVSRQEVISEIARFKAIVQVVDGTDSKRLSDAALFLYRVLISKTYQKDPCPLVLFFTKTDLTSFHGEQKLAKRIEDQIETIKVSRRNQPDDNQNEEDLLKVQRGAFSLKQQEIQVVSGSSQKGEPGIQSLVRALEQACS